MYVPEFVALYEIIPYIRNFPLDDETIRVAVKDYVEGGEKRDAIVKVYGPIGYWNTSEVTDMSYLFHLCYTFNEDISKWDTSNVTTMEGMFNGAYKFNQPIGKWNTSKVTNMECMFCGAKNFNEDISNWDTSNVTDMYGMFSGAENFNQDISKWYTSSVYLKDLERKLKNVKEVVRATRSFFKVNPALIPIVSDYFEIDDLDIPFEDFCYDDIRYISSQVYEDALSICQQKAKFTSPKGLERMMLASDVSILLLGQIVKTKIMPYLCY